MFPSSPENCELRWLMLSSAIVGITSHIIFHILHVVCCLCRRLLYYFVIIHTSGSNGSAAELLVNYTHAPLTTTHALFIAWYRRIQNKMYSRSMRARVRTLLNLHLPHPHAYSYSYARTRVMCKSIRQWGSENLRKLFPPRFSDISLPCQAYLILLHFNYFFSLAFFLFVSSFFSFSLMRRILDAHIRDF